jgi:hypothetical protein
MLTTGEVYRDAGGDYFTGLDPDKQTRRLVAQLELVVSSSSSSPLSGSR